MDDQKVLAGKSVLITGAAQGLGKSFAELFLEKGAKFVFLVDVDEELGRETEEYFLQKYPEKVIFIHCDVTKENDVVKAFNIVEETGYGLDVVVNNAGMCNEGAPLLTVDVNLRGLIQSSLLAWNKMRRDKGGNGGTIVNISSTAALNNHEDHYVNTGVRLLTICFGYTNTNLVKEDCKDINQVKFVVFVDYRQSVESATKGFLQMFENGATGSVWLCQNDEPVIDITERIQKAYEIMYTY